MTQQKYILCRPQGGLNDILCVIELCCRYAEATRRTVIVDTDYKHSVYFRSTFSKFFQSRQAKLVLDATPYLTQIAQGSVYPHFLQGRLNDYQTTPIKNGQRSIHIDTATNQPVAFDMKRSYPETTLVWQQFGGGNHSINALLRMTLETSLVRAIEHRLDAIPRPYLGVHVRHTDYKSSYEDYLNALSRHTRRPVFVATDNTSVLEQFQQKLGASHVFSFSNLASANGEPIHEFRTPGLNYYERNRDAILDLLTLALADNLKILAISGSHYSGFSMLAKNLWSTKAVLSMLLQGTNLRIGLD